VKISNAKKEEIDTVHAIRLIIVLFDTFKGKLDNYLELFIKFIAEQLKMAKAIYAKLILIQTISTFFIYNPINTINILETLKLTMPIFEAWFLYIKNMQFDFELKRTLMGLASILLIPPTNLNQAVKTNMGLIFKQIISLCKGITEIKEKIKLTEETNISDDEDDEVKIEKLKAAIEEAQKKADDQNELGLLEEEEEFDDENSFEINRKDHKTYIENQCEFTYVKSVLNYVHQSNQAYYGELLSLVTEEEKTSLTTSIEKSEKRNKENNVSQKD